MQQNERHTDLEPEVSIWTVIPVGFLILLVIGVVIGGILKSTNFGPGVGDIVSFDSPVSNLDQLPITAALADQPAGASRKSCLLRAEMMVNGGGSLVVEGRDLAGKGAFRVRWAGPRTSAGNDDCGRTAELLVSPNDLLALAASAGGFGITHKRLVMSSTALGSATAIVE